MITILAHREDLAMEDVAPAGKPSLNIPLILTLALQWAFLSSSILPSPPKLDQ